MGTSVVVFWCIFAVVVAIASNGRGRNPLGWFVLACVISPLLAFILLVALPLPFQETERLSWVERREGRARQCPYCAESIRREAVVCKHCGRDLPLSEPAADNPYDPNTPQGKAWAKGLADRAARDAGRTDP